MANLRKMNILVMGGAGAGKSTLIDAISGAQICDGLSGEATKVIDMFESSTWPLRIIDTKGFESGLIDQLKAVWQINKYAREMSSSELTGDDDGAGIDAVWYCVDGSADALDTKAIDMMNMAIRKLHNVPVFVALTKAVSEEKTEKHIDELMKIFAKCRNFNLKGIIPIVAKTFETRGELEATPTGVEELCTSTVDCFDTAHIISRENREHMKQEQRRFTANGLVAAAAAAGVVVGAIPTMPVADSAILVPLETGMTKGILKTYDIGATGDLLGAVVGSAAITNVAKAAVSSLKTIPNVAGSVINAVVAGVFVTAIGEAVISLSEAINGGKIDKDQLDLVSNFLGNQLTDNRTIGPSVRYINDNAEKFKDKSAKQIFEMLTKAVRGDKPTGPDLSAPVDEPEKKTAPKADVKKAPEKKPSVFGAAAAKMADAAKDTAAKAAKAAQSAKDAAAKAVDSAKDAVSDMKKKNQ